MGGMRPADGLWPHLRQPDGADVPSLHKLSNGSDCLLDGNVGIEAGRAIDVDMVYSKPRQAVGQEVLYG